MALIDRLSLKGLNRLGAASPLAECHTYYDAVQDEDDAKVSRLAALAAEKLQAARLLLEQQLADSALELLLSALLAAAAERAGLDTPVNPQEAGVWVYGEAVPGGILNPQEVGLIMRGISLAQCPSVPDNLITELADDVEGFVSSLTPVISA